MGARGPAASTKKENKTKQPKNKEQNKREKQNKATTDKHEGRASRFHFDTEQRGWLNACPAHPPEGVAPS